MTRTFSVFIALLWCVATFHIAGTCHADDPELTLELSAKTIRQLDPVMCRIALRNTTDEKLTFRHPISNGVGTLFFEVLWYVDDGGEEQWLRRPLYNEGVDLTVMLRPLEIQPDEKFVLYQLLYLARGGDPFLFAEGTHEVRVGIHYDKTTFYSNPVRIKVEPIPQKEWWYFKENRKHNYQYVGGTSRYVTRQTDLEPLREAERTFGESELKRQIQLELRFAEVVHAEPDKLAEELRRFKKEVDQLPQIWRVPACAYLGHYAEGKKRFDLLEEMIDGIDDEWRSIRGLRKTVDQWKQREAEAAKAAP
jgi:hypothetical protein